MQRTILTRSYFTLLRSASTRSAAGEASSPLTKSLLRNGPFRSTPSLSRSYASSSPSSSSTASSGLEGFSSYVVAGAGLVGIVAAGVVFGSRRKAIASSSHPAGVEVPETIEIKLSQARSTVSPSGSSSKSKGSPLATVPASHDDQGSLTSPAQLIVERPELTLEEEAERALRGDQEEEDEDPNSAAFNPETGEINWDCSCLGGMAHGICGEEFKTAFSCFVFSDKEPKGSDCIEGFQAMQDCFRAHPDVYGAELTRQEEMDYSAEEAVSAEDTAAPPSGSKPVSLVDQSPIAVDKSSSYASQSTPVPSTRT